MVSGAIVANWGAEIPSPRSPITGGRFPSSSFVIVPVAVPVAVTVPAAPETLILTVKVSSASTAASSVVATVKVSVSPAVPAKLTPAVFSV